MARHTTLTLVQSTWTELTDGDLSTQITFTNEGGQPILVQATTSSTAPSSTDGAITFNSGAGSRGLTIAEIFPGLTGPVRLWARCAYAGKVAVSHG